MLAEGVADREAEQREAGASETVGVVGRSRVHGIASQVA